MRQNDTRDRNSDAGMLTVGDVARLLHVHANSVRRWTNSGLLRSYRIGVRGDRRFRVNEVEEFIESRTNSGGNGW